MKQIEPGTLFSAIRDPLPRFCESYRLTSREREVLELLIAGRAQKEIAGDLRVSESTIRFHSVGLYKKCAVRNQREMLALVARLLRGGSAQELAGT